MSSWIRVDTHISQNPRLARARRILQVDKATMVGYYVLLEAELAEQRPTGELDGLSVEVLAEWAGYGGELAPFKKAITALTEEGKLSGWDDTQGRRIEYLENERERKRAARERRRQAREASKGAAIGATKEAATASGASPGTSAERPADSPRNSEDVQQVRYGTVRNDTVRYGTVPESSLASEASSVVPEQLKRASDARPPARESKEPEPARSPLAHANSDNGNSDSNRNGNGARKNARDGKAATRDPFALPPVARQLLERCYGQSKIPGRYAAVRQQLLETLGAEGALLEGDQRVQAVDATHLDAACTAVLGGTLKKPEAAIRLVLLKLRDTYAERSAALDAVAHTAAHSKRGTAASVGQVLQTVPQDRSKADERRERALAWGKANEARADLIIKRLKREHGRLSDHAIAEFAIGEFAAAMEAEDREAADPNTATAGATADAAAGGA